MDANQKPGNRRWIMPSKNQILSEIKRTAAANGGVPLGQDRFESETGIKHGYWNGLYWARWNDAIREAGLTPNELRSAYATDDMLERYANLARELGQLPNKGDIRIKKRSDPSLPNDRAFDRFGGKRKLIEQVLAFCQNRSGYEQVVRSCEEYLSSRPESDETDESVSAKNLDFGFVYLIRSGRYYKIGRSNAAGRREYEIALQLPDKAVMMHKISTDDPVGIEGYWHQRFKHKRKNGEWFELKAEDVTAFKRRKSM